MKGKIKVGRVREPLPVRFVSGHRFTRRVAMRVAEAIKDYIPKVAVPVSPYRFAAQHVFFLFLSLPFALAAPFLAFLVHPAFLLLLLAPPAAFFAPWLRLKSMVGDRKRATDGELPFFAIHAAIAQSAGLNLFESLCSTIGKRVFRQVERGARIVRRNARSEGPIRALEELGRDHPHSGMKTLLLGYTSEFHSGGNVTRYLEDKAEEFLRLTRHRWDRYMRDVGTMEEIVLAVLFVFPILVLMATFLSPGSAMTLGLGFIAVGIPMSLAVCFSIIRSGQPRDYSEYEGSLVLPLILAPAAFIVAWCFAPGWIALSVSVGVGFLAYGFPVLLQRRRALSHERSLPQFLRDVTEYQKLNYPLLKAVTQLYEEGKYTKGFNRLLGYVVKQLGTGRRFSELHVPTRSWLTRMTFFHLGQVAETGGFATRSMELLTDFTTRVKETRDEVRASANFYRGFAIVTPFAMALIVGGVMGMLGMLSMPEIVGATAEFGTLPIIPTEPSPLFFGMASAIILASSVGISFLTSYAADFTPKNTAWVALNAFLATAAIWLVPAISEGVTGILGF